MDKMRIKYANKNVNKIEQQARTLVKIWGMTPTSQKNPTCDLSPVIP